MESVQWEKKKKKVINKYVLNKILCLFPWLMS